MPTRIVKGVPHVTVGLRLPDPLYDAVKIEMLRWGRSMNTELIALVEEGLRYRKLRDDQFATMRPAG